MAEDSPSPSPPGRDRDLFKTIYQALAGAHVALRAGMRLMVEREPELSSLITPAPDDDPPCPPDGSAVAALATLSPTEREVFQLIGQGKDNGAIAKIRHRSKKTVESLRANIKKKLGFKSGTKLVQFAWQVAHPPPSGNGS